MVRRFLVLPLLLAPLLVARTTYAQASPTATRGIQLSAFGGVAGVYTGLADGRNASIVAGADLAFTVWHGVSPSVELRGLYPIDSGSIVGQRSILFGPRVALFPNRRFHPYGDFLFGRGQMNYVDHGDGGYDFNGFTYVESPANLYSPGFGLDYDLTPHLSLRFDGQAQHWGYAPTPSRSIWSKVGTVGIVYRFNFGPRRVP